MDIEQAKDEIARRAFNAGFAFDRSEIIDAPLEGQTLVALRSVRALRLVERDDGTQEYELYNEPIIWIDMPSPLLNQIDIDQDRRVLRYTFHQPTPRIVYPEFCILLPTPSDSAPCAAPAAPLD